MAAVSITDAARLVGVSEKTIRRKIATGEVSAQVAGQGGQVRKLIDTSELLRVFGSLSGQLSEPVQGQSPVTSTQLPDMSTAPGQAFIQLIDTQKVLIGVLQSQLDARTQETRELRAQVVGLLEWRRPDPPVAVTVPEPSTVSVVPAVTRRDLVVGVLVAAVSGCAWAWVNGYRLWFLL